MTEIVVKPKPFVLIVLDGVGVAPPGPGNAVTLAKTNFLDKLWFKYPHCYLHASGSAVGLPSGTNGNSEVGHLNIGAGKVVYQELPRIDNAITNKTFFTNETLIEATNHVKKNSSRIHLLGLVSNGNVHSSIAHLFACLRFCKEQGVSGEHVAIHAFTDGRDTPPKSATTYLEELESESQRLKTGFIASVIGRFYAMDRDERWDRTKIAYDMLVEGAGKQFRNWRDAINDAYSFNETDEFISPRIIVGGNGDNLAKISPNDAVIFFNYRPDRAIQLTKSFVLDDFTSWQRGPRLENIIFVGLNQYEEGLPELAAFPPEDISLPIGRIMSESGMRQLRISESEKFPHVTYFINGGNEVKYTGEDRIEIPSTREVATYDQKPEMSAYEVTNTILQKFKEGIYDFYILNFANGDMVAHTGSLEATIRAIEVVDECLGKIIDNILSLNGAAIVTADHGNAEELINLQTGETDTEHSTNPVPFMYIRNDLTTRELSFGILADIAPTILNILGIPKPSVMTGRNLLV